MPWICPYCGTENEQDGRVGRQEPPCRSCKNPRATPEELARIREAKISSIKKDLEELNEVAGKLRDSIEFHASIIAEHQQDLNDARKELGELREDAAPLKEALKRWEDQEVFYEKRDKAFMAEQDPFQTKLPFEVPA